jgi:2-methylaconitate cis-trans-isomerase PrpF
MWLVIAVLLAAVGKLLIDQGLVEGEVSTALERVWNHTNVRLAPVPKVCTQVEGDAIC